MTQEIPNYNIVRPLGAGAMGEVFLAEDTRLNRRVAIKILAQSLAADANHRARFLREARAASALNHPNICVIHDIGETIDRRPFFAMEYIAGDDLAGVMEKRRIEIAEVIEIALQVADALDAAQAQDIIHRDIKPSNISLDARGRVKVLDFGLAKQLGSTDQDEAAAAPLVTAVGSVVGTPAFMSPEQALARPVDHRSDLFSLGAVLYYLVTRRVPFGGSNFAEVTDNVIHAIPEAIARFNYEVPAELERITLKLLEKDPGRRYQSARELLVDLKNLKRGIEHASLPGAVSSTQLGSVSGVGPMETLPHGEMSLTAGDESGLTAPEKLSHSDVVITYADIDDRPIAAGRQGWISQFHRNLELRVAQLSGKQVTVLKQPDPSSAVDVEAEVLRRVPDAKTVVSVMSPPFIRSSGCRRLLETFWRSAEDSGVFEVANRSRVLNVVKTHVDEDDIPAEIRPLLSRLAPYEFFERDPNSGRIREFDEAFGQAAVQRFYERIYDVAYDISQVLKYMGDVTLSSPGKKRGGKTIFLAATTSDLEPQRDQLRRELIELGHDVLPRQPLPLVAKEITTVVQGCLAQSDLAIHFVGEHYGFVPEATDLSIIGLQNRVAAEHSAGSGLPRLIWMAKELTPQDERQTAFIQELHCNPQVTAGAELIVDTLENLKVLLRSRWQRELAAADRPKGVAAAAGPPRLYIICDREDEDAVEPLEDFFYEQGIDVSLPGFEADESEIQEIHIQNLRDCDAALIFYGAAGKHWVDFNIRDLQKAAGYRDSQPIPVSAVYLAPPFNRRKERFKSVMVETIKQESDSFDPSVLQVFVQSLLQGRGAK